MCQPSRPATAQDAAAAATAGLSWLASADTGALTTAEQADLLRALERAGAQLVAARSAVLAAFDAARGFEDDGAGTSRTWLTGHTRVTGASAAAAVGWMRRLTAHPAVAGALAAGAISASFARQVCDWTTALPDGARGDADHILVEAACGGAGLADLAGLAEEIHRRCAGPDTDPDDDGFADRSLRLSDYYRGNGQLTGNLSPECTASVRAVLDALGCKAGPADTRTRAQRDHDALAEACRLLIAAGTLPSRAGQPASIQLHMSLEQLLSLPGARTAVAEWAGRGATAGPGAACDAAISPVVTGHVDPELLDQLAATLLRPGTGADSAPMARTAARELVLDRATRLLSGPAGLAAWLRTSLTTGPVASISLPLDIGYATDVVPSHLRRAIVLRDQHCRFPACNRRPAHCQVHHIIPWSEGGPTSLCNCLLLCSFHHLIAVHRWGWQIRLNPDGTTTATSPDGKARHSHSPPGQAA